jgi:hypothetical protein
MTNHSKEIRLNSIKPTTKLIHLTIGFHRRLYASWRRRPTDDEDGDEDEF